MTSSAEPPHTGTYLADLRARAGLRPVDLAEKIGGRVSEANVVDWEAHGIPARMRDFVGEALAPLFAEESDVDGSQRRSDQMTQEPDEVWLSVELTKSIYATADKLAHGSLQGKTGMELGHRNNIMRALQEAAKRGYLEGYKSGKAAAADKKHKRRPAIEKDPITNSSTCDIRFRRSAAVGCQPAGPPQEASSRRSSPSCGGRQQRHRVGQSASGIYHYPGERWYGKTEDGEYMKEDVAIKDGYRATENGQ